MKKIIVFAVSLFMIVDSFCQQPIPGSQSYRQEHLIKSKKQKTAAWILMGVGIFSAGVLGTAKTNPDGIIGGDNSRSTGFQVAGLTAISASIPLFIASRRNKRKAMNTSAQF